MRRAASLLGAAMLLAITVALPATAQPDSNGTHVLLSPSHGPVGTHVRLSGTVPVRDLETYRQRGYFTLIRESAGCELRVVLTSVDWHVADNGRVNGSFVVGDHGVCFMGDGSTHSARVGRYGLSIGCHACAVGFFRITSAGVLPRTGRSLIPLALTGLGLVMTGVGALVIEGRREGSGGSGSRSSRLPEAV